MTHEEQNEAIAKAMGYYRPSQEEDVEAFEKGWWYRPPGDNSCAVCIGIPSFTSDLNACAEMENRLLINGCSLTNGRVTYGNKLMSICGSHAACVSATAAQRVEAMLKLLKDGVIVNSKAIPGSKPADSASDDTMAKLLPVLNEPSA